MRCLDLFAGCGGLSYGLQIAGCDVIGAVEVDKWAGDTYELNHPGVTLHRRPIENISNEEISDLYQGVDCVVGGPPCQGFSVSGKRQSGILLPQNTLVGEWIRIVSVIKPRIVLLENVGGFSSAQMSKGKKALNFVLNALEEIGYHVSAGRVQAADFGLPSFRSRVFVIGSLKGFKIDPIPSPKSLQVLGENVDRTTVADAISDLPQIQACEGRDGRQAYPGRPGNGFQEWVRKGSNGVYNHEAMKHTNRLVERFSQIPQGSSAYKSINTSGETATIYKSNNQRLRADEPSLCITANFQSTYIHPWLNRNLTAREAARLMTFPDTFVFKGKRTQMSKGFVDKYKSGEGNYLSQYNQIGNAVPPLLACYVYSYARHAEDREVSMSYGVPIQTNLGF